MSDVAHAVARLLLQAALESQRKGHPGGGEPLRDGTTEEGERSAAADLGNPGDDGAPGAAGLLSPPKRKMALSPSISQHHQRSGPPPDSREAGHA